MTDKTDKTEGDGAVGPEQVEAFDPLPGDLLREARNRRGWTVSRVAEDMNLEVRFVEAMEENRFEDLGAPVFARGHLRKYARLLEVDSNRLMQAYAVIEKERIPPPVASAEGLRMTGDEPAGGSGWRTIAIILVLVALGVLGWRLLTTRGDVATPAVGVTAPQSSAEETARDNDAIDGPVAVPLPAIVTATEPPSEADDALEPTPPETADGEAATPAAATAASGEPVDAGESEEQTSVEETPVPAGEARLVLRFTADSWVEVRDASGNRLVYQLGRAGRQRAVTGRPPFDIFLGFADGVSLELNGETVIVPASARLGRTASFRVPADTAAAIPALTEDSFVSALIRPIRGMNDALPAETPVWQWLEDTVRRVLQAYGYGEIRMPLLEKTELFARSIGEVTDIVEKEMYTFPDRNGESLSLRPEATASCVRAAITHGLLHNQQHRLWYAGPMFRYERPQKGRYRQFHQIGAEAYGFPGPDVDAELICVSARIWQQLGLEGLQLELNSLGTPASRQAYRELLVTYFEDHRAMLDEDSLRRLDKNPLRILDSKNPAMQALIADAPLITDHLDAESAEHFAGLQSMLSEAGVSFVLKPRLVRGLDYYTRTVFEWTTDRLGAQSAVCSGGRYDELVAQLGGQPTPAVGWAMGLERLVELLRAAEATPPAPTPHAYFVPLGEAAEARSLALAESLRDALPGLRLSVHCGGGGMKARMRKADRSGARYALIVGDDELAAGSVVIKPLRGGEQATAAVDHLADELRQRCPELTPAA